MNISIWLTSERFSSDCLTKNETTPMTLHDLMTSLKPLVLLWEGACGRNYTLCVWVSLSMGGFGEFCVCERPKWAEWRKNKGSQQHWQVDSTRLQSIVSITPPVVLQFWSFSFKAEHPTFISIRMFTLLMSCYKPLFLMTSDFRGGLSSRRRTSPS